MTNFNSNIFIKVLRTIKDLNLDDENSKELHKFIWTLPDEQLNDLYNLIEEDKNVLTLILENIKSKKFANSTNDPAEFTRIFHDEVALLDRIN